MSLSALSYKTKSQPSDFTLFEPFSVDLWMAVLGALLAYAALLVILSGVLSRCSRRTPTKPLTDMVSSSYHTFSACVGGEDYEWISGPMRVLRLSLLTFVLVIGSTYTANLAAFFTAPSFTILGPTNSDEFKAAVVCTNSNTANRLAPFVKGTVVLPFPSEPSAGQNKNQCEWCSTSTQPSVRHLTPPLSKKPGMAGQYIEKLSSGECSAWADDANNLLLHHLDNCGTTQMLPYVNLLPTAFVLMLPQEERKLAINISAAIAFIDGSPQGVELRERAFRSGETCSVAVEATTQVTAKQMVGLFYICGGLAFLALLFASCRSVLGILHRFGHTGGDRSLDHTATEGEMLRLLIDKVDRLAAKEAGGGDAPPAAHHWQKKRANHALVSLAAAKFRFAVERRQRPEGGTGAGGEPAQPRGRATCTWTWRGERRAEERARWMPRWRPGPFAPRSATGAGATSDEPE